MVVPTRGRPKSARRLADACAGTEAWPVFVVDEDDPELDGYRKILTPDEGLLIAPTGRPGIVDPLNWSVSAILEKNSPRYISFLGDDHLPRTPGWDVLMLETLGQLGTGICYGNDLLAGERIPTAVFMTADIPRALGYMAPPRLNHLFVDDAWLAWGKGIDRIVYREDVIIEHLHFLNGKADKDATYIHANDANSKKDGFLWREYQAKELAGDIERLKGLL